MSDETAAPAGVDQSVFGRWRREQWLAWRRAGVPMSGSMDGGVAHVALVLRAQGHHPDADDAERVARLLAGTLTVAEAYAEVDAELGVHP